MKPNLLVVAFAGLLTSVALVAADVATNWENHCASCHGPDGRGETKMGKRLKIRNLTDPAVQAQFTDEDATKAIKEGVKDANGKTTMKPVEELSDDVVKALVAYVRSLKK
jgi:mono/diheme cytochrome c family protein